MAARVWELRAQHEALIHKANAALLKARASAKDKNLKELPAEEKAEQDRLDVEIAGVRGELEAEETMLARERSLGSTYNRNPHAPAVPGSGRQYNPGDEDAADDDAPAVSMLPPLPRRTRAAIARLYGGAAVGDHVAARDQFRDVVAAALGGNPLSPAIVKASIGGEYSDPDGGYAVAPETARGIFLRAAEGSLWLRLGCRFEPMTTSEKRIVCIGDDDETDSAEATAVAERRPETVANTSVQIAKLRIVSLKASKWMITAAVSNEIGEDAPGDFVPALEEALVRAVAKRFDRAAISGVEYAESGGMIASPATITIPAIANQAADTIEWDNLTTMWSRLATGSHERSVWIASPTALPALMKVFIPTGAGGIQPKGLLEAGGPSGYTMLTRPLYLTSRVPVLGTAGDIILADPSQFVIGVRRALSVQRSEHAYFLQDLIGLRASFRGCALSMWDKAQTNVDGITRSPFVVLATR